MIDFIGIGAQKSGTSWIYACLYEHPEICAPIKEIHFFSRPRYEKGISWYESHFKNCDDKKKKGEFSTSYLYSKEAAERIKKSYPKVKIIAVLRNPIDRAISQYGNAIKAGEITDTVSFSDYLTQEKSALEQGTYSEQLERFYACFPREQVLVLLYEDIKKDPGLIMQTIYRFLNVDETFIPTQLHSMVNVARAPRLVAVDRLMHHFAEALRKIGFDKLVWAIRNSGLPERIRNVNTKTKPVKEGIDGSFLRNYFVTDAIKLQNLINRDVRSEWNI